MTSICFGASFLPEIRISAIIDISSVALVVSRQQTSRNKKNVKDLVESSTLSTQLTPGKVIIKFGSVEP